MNTGVKNGEPNMARQARTGAWGDETEYSSGLVVVGPLTNLSVTIISIAVCARFCSRLKLVLLQH